MEGWTSFDGADGLFAGSFKGGRVDVVLIGLMDFAGYWAPHHFKKKCITFVSRAKEGVLSRVEGWTSFRWG